MFFFFFGTLICLDHTVLIDIKVTVFASHANDIEMHLFSVLQDLNGKSAGFLRQEAFYFSYILEVL